MPYVTNSGRGLLDYLFGQDDQPFDDSWRDQWSQSVGNTAGILGFNPNRTASTTRRVIDFVPGVGDAISLNDAKRDFDAGNYGSAALNAGTGILGLLPGGGDAAVAGGKGLLAMLAPMAKKNITNTAWVFKDVKHVHPRMERGDWAEVTRASKNDEGVMEVELPIHSINASQPSVNPDFAKPISEGKNTKAPFVIKKGGEYYLQDGHHRLTKAAFEGRQTAPVRLLDLDGTTQTDFPLIDYMNQGWR